MGWKTPNKQTLILRSYTDKVNGLIIHEILKTKFIRVTFAFDYKVAYMGIRLMKDYCRKLCVIISFVIFILKKKRFSSEYLEHGIKYPLLTEFKFY